MKMQDELLKEQLYAQGFALLQYCADVDCYLARFKDKLYEVHDSRDIFQVVSDVAEFGCRKAPIARILSLPNTKEHKQ